MISWKVQMGGMDFYDLIYHQRYCVSVIYLSRVHKESTNKYQKLVKMKKKERWNKWKIKLNWR